MWLFCFFFTYFMFVFFFKQKTAYEMRISDWSSDVCSSDLFDRPFIAFPLPELIKLFALFAFKRLHHRTGCCQTGEDNEISVRSAIGGCNIQCRDDHAIADRPSRTRPRIRPVATCRFAGLPPVLSVTRRHTCRGTLCQAAGMARGA